MPNRRTFLIQSTATLGAITVMPIMGRATGDATLSFADGKIIVHPVEHASFVMETPKGVIYVDTVGTPEHYADFPKPDLILITHEHGDHYNPELLEAIGGDAPLLTNPTVQGMLPEKLAARASALANGETGEALGYAITAIPAYNTTEERQKFHPKGRDNGYVLEIDGARVYISGDTEGTPEMQALENIDVAFMCMNLPFTMTAEDAAAAVASFKPGIVVPYHYRGRDGGTQDPQTFAKALKAAGGDATVTFHDWYNGTLS